MEYGYGEPLNIALLASFMRERGVEVRIADELAGQSVEEILDSYVPDLVGVTAVTPLVYDAYRIAESAGNRNITTVSGGPHASVMTKEVLQHFDVVVQGEGEYALYHIISNGIENGVVKSDQILEVNQAPSPARDLLLMDYYLKTRQRNSNNPNLFFVPLKENVLTMLVSRGCHWKCSYCCNSWKDLPVRFRSPDLVVEEMNQIYDIYGVKYFLFLDDNIFGNRKYCQDLFKSFINNKNDYYWGANSRVDCVDEKTLDLAKQAGCRRINFGFESGSQRVLDNLNKKTKVEKIEKAVNLCKSLRIDALGTFMLGNPGETMEDIELTRRLILDLHLCSVGITFTTAFPGTQLWEKAKGEGKIPERLDWSLFDFDHVPIPISDCFTEKQLFKIRRKLYVEAYLRNLSILRNVIRAFLLNPLAVIKRIWAVIFSA